MSSSYKPALLKALVRIVREGDGSILYILPRWPRTAAIVSIITRDGTIDAAAAVATICASFRSTGRRHRRFVVHGEPSITGQRVE